MKKLLIALPIVGMFFLSCEIDQLNEKPIEDSPKVSSRNSGFHLETIDNGLDGQILVFDSSDSYRTVQEDLFNQTEIYTESFQEKIPRDLDDEKLEEFLNNVNYNEDIIYEKFEESIGFNSFRVKLNKDISTWLEYQNDQKTMIDEENDPDNNTLVLESDRTLYNMGGEVIVLDSVKNPIIYKAFDWGYLAVHLSDVKVIKDINMTQIKTLSEIKSKVKDFSNANIILDLVNFPTSPCTTNNIKSKKHVFSANGQHNVKSIIKNRNTPFDNSGEHDRLIIKTKGYLWKRGKWRHRSVWLVSGYTSKRNQSDLPITWWSHNCDSGTQNTKLYKTATKCALKFEYNGGPINNVAWKDNSLYAYHGQGTFSFTVDFFPSHEVYRITN